MPTGELLPPTFNMQPGGLFRLAVDALPCGVLILAADGQIVLANPGIERQFGYSHDALLGESVETLLPGLVNSFAPVGVYDTEAPEMRPLTAAHEHTGRHHDGRDIQVEVRLTPVAAPEGAFILASVVDVTEPEIAQSVAGQTVAKQLEFERLIAEISHQFINLPADRVLDAIRQALHQVGEALKLDRCVFWRMPPRGAPVVAIAWHRQNVEPTPPARALSEEFPWLTETLLAGRTVAFSSRDEVPSAVDRSSYEARDIRSGVSLPLSVGGRVVGVLSFNMVHEERSWTPETLHAMRMIASVFSSVSARAESDETLLQALSEVERLREQLHAENLYLRREVEDYLGTGLIIGQTTAIKRVLEQLRQVAPTDSTVLLHGETGTGKELFATYLHGLSTRRERMMVRVNCSAIPTTLIESELFGREKGAYTGALARQIGRFELADHSTIFLDEIGELPPDVQVKLLRVLEERQIERLGSPKSIRVDVRVVAATHRNLEQRIADGVFRDDLYYRLNVFPIYVPPLRERVEDIPLLVWRFVTEFSKTFGKRIEAITRENMAVLQRYSWPGNIRELRNVVERAMIMATGTWLTINVPAPAAAPGQRSLKLIEVEKEHMLSVLKSAGWRIRGAGGAADQLGLKPTTLETRMAKLGIARPRPS